MSRPHFVGFLLLAVAGCLAGETDRPVGRACDSAEECAEGMVCSYGRCRPTCSFDRDCPEGSTCVPASAEPGGSVCTLPDEGCAACPGDLVCGSDRLCREPCDEAGECTGGRRCDGEACVDGPLVAALPVVELDPTGDRNAHPAVAFFRGEFVLATLAGSGGPLEIVLRFLAPGEALPSPPSVLTDGSAERGSLTLAAHPDVLAVGWSESTDGVRTFRYTVWPGAAVARSVSTVLHADDHDDGRLVWDGDDLVAILRRGSAGAEELWAVDLGPFGGAPATPEQLGLSPLFGNLSVTSTPDGPLVVSGATARVFERRAGRWSELDPVAGLSSPAEAAVAALTAGPVVGFFSYQDEARTLQAATAVLQPDRTGYRQLAPPLLLEGWGGPDQALSRSGDRLGAAWIFPSLSPRQLAIAVLGPDGALLEEPCLVESSRPTANDPDLACGDGVCAALWIEGADYDDTAFVTRLVQFPLVAGGLRP